MNNNIIFKAFSDSSFLILDGNSFAITLNINNYNDG